MMGASEAADVLFAKEIERSDDPRAAREEKIRKCMQASSPFTAARYGMGDVKRLDQLLPRLFRIDDIVNHAVSCSGKRA